MWKSIALALLLSTAGPTPVWARADELTPIQKLRIAVCGYTKYCVQTRACYFDKLGNIAAPAEGLDRLGIEVDDDIGAAVIVDMQGKRAYLDIGTHTAIDGVRSAQTPIGVFYRFDEQTPEQKLVDQKTFTAALNKLLYCAQAAGQLDAI